MKPKVLDVGQCSYDHRSIRSLMESLGAEVHRADSIPEALEKISNGSFRLVLVNRKIDRDNSDGLELVRAMQNRSEMHETPVMLISNYPEAQRAAQEEGALKGFGKGQLRSPDLVHRLKRILS